MANYSLIFNGLLPIRCTFAGRKVYVYRSYGGHLRDIRWTFAGFKLLRTTFRCTFTGSSIFHYTKVYKYRIWCSFLFFGCTFAGWNGFFIPKVDTYGIFLTWVDSFSQPLSLYAAMISLSFPRWSGFCQKSDHSKSILLRFISPAR